MPGSLLTVLQLSDTTYTLPPVTVAFVRNGASEYNASLYTITFEQCSKDSVDRCHSHPPLSTHRPLTLSTSFALTCSEIPSMTCTNSVPANSRCMNSAGQLPATSTTVTGWLCPQRSSRGPPPPFPTASCACGWIDATAVAVTRRSQQARWGLRWRVLELSVCPSSRPGTCNSAFPTTWTRRCPRASARRAASGRRGTLEQSSSSPPRPSTLSRTSGCSCRCGAPGVAGAVAQLLAARRPAAS